jgi:tRNA dimethylallyltransferase
MRPKLIVIGGPTASGKTGLAIQLAQHFQTEIISADSRQCYRELTIGTAKPSEDELLLVKHHFINSHSISENLNAGSFSESGQELLKKLFKKFNVLVVAGGSGLYIKALLEGLDNLPAIDQEIRNELKQEFLQTGIEPLKEELKAKDSIYYDKVDRQNHQRIIRALEIIRTSGLPYSSFLGKKQKRNDFDLFNFAIDWPREQLYERIDLRVSKMMQAGLLEEVSGLVSFKNHPALRTVGYSELFDFFDGKTSLETAIDLIRQHSRNYAKRQITWFANQGNYKFLPPGSEMKILKEIKNAN